MFVLDQLEQSLGEENFASYEGSRMVGDIVPGGLETFKEMKEQEKVDWRRRAIDEIGRRASGKAAAVAGHFIFWTEKQEAGQITLSVAHLQKWQEAEKIQLPHLCRQYSILFSLVNSDATQLDKVSMLERDFQLHTEGHNLACAERKLDEAVAAGQGQPETMLVIDADKTLAAEHTGAKFLMMISEKRQSSDKAWTLHNLFGRPLGYSYTAFRQATLLYEEAADDQEFEPLCHDVGIGRG
ncbi:MAG: hypothetical protein Q9225_007091 [Loekoesia sp. 1 TL-2023]